MFIRAMGSPYNKSEAISFETIDKEKYLSLTNDFNNEFFDIVRIKENVSLFKKEFIALSVKTNFHIEGQNIIFPKGHLVIVDPKTFDVENQINNTDNEIISEIKNKEQFEQELIEIQKNNSKGIIDILRERFTGHSKAEVQSKPKT